MSNITAFPSLYLTLTPTAREALIQRRAEGQARLALSRINAQAARLTRCHELHIDTQHLLPELWAQRREYRTALAALTRQPPDLRQVA